VTCYSQKVFALLPHLSMVDGHDRAGLDIESDDEGAKDDNDDDNADPVDNEDYGEE
jgi:hypothetical protein